MIAGHLPRCASPLRVHGCRVAAVPAQQSPGCKRLRRFLWSPLPAADLRTASLWASASTTDDTDLYIYIDSSMTLPGWSWQCLAAPCVAHHERVHPLQLQAGASSRISLARCSSRLHIQTQTRELMAQASWTSSLSTLRSASAGLARSRAGEELALFAACAVSGARSRSPGSR